jgi:hypothetical protein
MYGELSHIFCEPQKYTEQHIVIITEEGSRPKLASLFDPIISAYMANR